MPLVDRDGIAKPTLQIIIEECLASGIEDIAIVVEKGGEGPFREHFARLTEAERQVFKGKEWAIKQAEMLERIADCVTYVEQPAPEGYGHAVYQTKEFVNGEPFLLLLGDHVYLSGSEKRCAQQVIDTYAHHQCAVSSVQQTPADSLHLFGTVTGTRLGQADPPTYEVSAIYEKPSIEYAAEHLQTEGVKEGNYLCFFGMHVFPPSIFDCLEEHIVNDWREKGEIQLTSSQELLRQRERYVAVETVGQRLDMGVPLGYIETQMALALSSVDREEVLEILQRHIALSASVPPFERR